MQHKANPDLTGKLGLVARSLLSAKFTQTNSAFIPVQSEPAHQGRTQYTRNIMGQITCGMQIYHFSEDAGFNPTSDRFSLYLCISLPSLQFLGNCNRDYTSIMVAETD